MHPARLIGPAALFAALIAPVDASARPLCEPLEEGEFRSLVLDAQAAIDRDDPALHESIVEEVRERVPCLTFSPAPRTWADFLVGMAIVEFSRDGAWEPAMGAALRIRPTVDRGVGGGHPLATWEPPASPPPSPGPVPEGVRLFVDGVEVSALPPAEGLFLVQKEDQGFWATLLLEDAEIPTEWLLDPVERPRRLESSATLTAAFGPGGFHQHIHFGEDFVSDYIPDDDWIGAVPGLRGRILFRYGNVGMLGEASTSWAGFTRTTGGKLQAAAVLVRGDSVLGAGAGLAGADVFEEAGDFDDAIARTLVLPYVVIAGEHRYEGHWSWDFGGSFGQGQSHTRLEAYAGAQPPSSGAPWRYGLAASVASSSFEQRQRLTADREAVVTTWQLVGEIGWHFEALR